MPSKKGLPSVLKANPAQKPPRLGGLQPKKAAASQSRLNKQQHLLTKNKSAMISGASRAVQDVIDQQTIENEEAMYQLSARGKATMFQQIDDVQLQTHDPYYEEVDEAADMPTSARDHAQRRTQEPFGGRSSAASAQGGVFRSLQGGNNMQSQMLRGDSSSQVHMPKIKSQLAGTKSMATFTPANQLLLKIPKAPTDA